MVSANKHPPCKTKGKAGFDALPFFCAWSGKSRLSGLPLSSQEALPGVWTVSYSDSLKGAADLVAMVMAPSM